MKKIAIITAGQSNTDGRVPIEQLPSYISLPITNCEYASNYNGAVFKDNIQLSYLYDKKWAFDLVVYYYITQVKKEYVYIIKWSEGGTSIDENGGGDSHWTPFYEKLPSISSSLLCKFENLIKSCIKAKGDEFDIKAMLWHQGESDELVGDKYYENFKALIDYCRKIVGNEALPFICGTVAKKNKQYNEEVDAAIRKIASEDPNVYLVDMAKADLIDPYHFDALASEYFGKSAYNYLIDANVITGEKIDTKVPW